LDSIPKRRLGAWAVSLRETGGFDSIPKRRLGAWTVSLRGDWGLGQFPWKGQPVVVNASSANTFCLTQGQLQAAFSSSGLTRRPSAACGLVCMAPPPVLAGDGDDGEASSVASQQYINRNGSSMSRSRSVWGFMACTGGRDWAADDGGESVRSLDQEASIDSYRSAGTGSDHSGRGGSKAGLTGVLQPLRKAPSVMRQLPLPSCVTKVGGVPSPYSDIVCPPLTLPRSLVPAQ
jgi:hypothetical protein